MNCTPLSPITITNRGINWADAADTLIELWAEETIQIALENAKLSKFKMN